MWWLEVERNSIQIDKRHIQADTKRERDRADRQTETLRQLLPRSEFFFYDDSLTASWQHKLIQLLTGKEKQTQTVKSICQKAHQAFTICQRCWPRCHDFEALLLLYIQTSYQTISCRISVIIRGLLI